METYLRKIISKIHLKDIFTSTLLVISFSLCFLLVLNGIHMSQKISAVASIKRSNSYKETISMECVPLNEWSEVDREINPMDIINSLQIEKGNVELSNVFVTCGNIFSQKPASVFLKTTEAVVTKLQSGRYPTIEELREGKQVVIIGNSLCQYTETINDTMFLKVEGERYQVIGILEDDTASNMDERIVLFYDSIHPDLQYSIIKKLTGLQHGYILYYHTNQLDAETSINAFYAWIDAELEDEYREVAEEAQTSEGFLSFLAELNQWTIYILIVFGLMNCVGISNIWIKRRKKEFAIRKALGGTMLHIGKVIFAELFQLAIASMCMTLLIQGIYNTFDRSISFGNYRIQDIMYLFLGMLGCVIVTLLLPMIQIAKINPVQEIRK